MFNEYVSWHVGHIMLCQMSVLSLLCDSVFSVIEFVKRVCQVRVTESLFLVVCAL